MAPPLVHKIAVAAYEDSSSLNVYYGVRTKFDVVNGQRLDTKKLYHDKTRENASLQLCANSVQRRSIVVIVLTWLPLRSFANCFWRLVDKVVWIENNSSKTNKNLNV